MSDQPVAEAATYTEQETNIHALSGIRNLDLSNQARPPESASLSTITYPYGLPPLILPFALFILV